jgi:hypothetical protein
MPASFDFLSWGAATISTVGLTATCVIFLLGRLASGGGARAAAKGRRGRLRPGSDPLVEGIGRERRCHYRRSGNPTHVAIGHPENPTELARGVVVDRSSGGVCLELQTPLAVGSVVSVRPSLGTGAGAWIDVEVRHCRRDGPAWRVGFKFVRTPPLSALWMFG